MPYMNRFQSPLGTIFLKGDEECLTGLCFEDQCMHSGMFPSGGKMRDTDAFDQTKRWLEIYFNGMDPGFLPKFRIKCTPFRMRVLEIIQEIPHGRTMTYGDIAGRMARERGTGIISAQAVGGAAGRNPIPLVIPCHRVLGSRGKLTGYAGGLHRKSRLLELEGLDMKTLSLPGKRAVLQQHLKLF